MPAATESAIPYPVRLLDLLGIGVPSAQDILALWSGRREGPVTRVVLGADASGPVTVDLAGPGAAHDARRRHRRGQERPAADPGHRAAAREQAGRAEPRPRRLQGRRRVPAVRELPARHRADPVHGRDRRRHVRRGRRGPRARLGPGGDEPQGGDPLPLRRRDRQLLARPRDPARAGSAAPGRDDLRRVRPRARNLAGLPEGTCEGRGQGPLARRTPRARHPGAAGQAVTRAEEQHRPADQPQAKRARGKRRGARRPGRGHDSRGAARPRHDPFHEGRVPDAPLVPVRVPGRSAARRERQPPDLQAPGVGRRGGRPPRGRGTERRRPDRPGPGHQGDRGGRRSSRGPPALPHAAARAAGVRAA